MTELEGKGGGTVGKIWRQHGGGYYALLAVGTFLYLEVSSVTGSVVQAEGVEDFVRSELFSLGWETLLNSVFAGIWPVMWASWMGWKAAAAWAVGGYAVWAVLIAWALARRERALREELGL